LYSKHDFDEEIARAVWPAVITGLVSSLIVGGLALGLAARISRPVRGLNEQVNRIAKGQFVEMPIPTSNREVAELAQSINRMAAQLTTYEKQVRQTEQLHTLGLLGGGLAHQLRNTITGVRMAIDFHQEACTRHDDDSLSVARRQIELMEQYLKKFLSVATPSEKVRQPVNLSELIESFRPLVAPAARHAEVSLEFQFDGQATVMADAESLSQAILNLILNAIDAVQANDLPYRIVRVETHRSADGAQAIVRVIDNGPGPPPSIASMIFEPMVTGKKGGVGLGLYVTRKIITDHEGEICWHRNQSDETAGSTTIFEIRLPTH
jgi:hypothetical protein